MKNLKKGIKSVVSFSLAVVMLFSGISPLGIFAASASSFGVWQTDGNFTVTENGTYVIYAKDAVGNTTSIEITVNNIDYTPPTLDVGYSTTEWTKDGVKLVLTSVDQASPGGTAGTVSLSVVGSDGTSYPTDYLFTSNTSGTVTSTDDVGNAVSKPFSITNVDTTVPSISISSDVTSPTNGNVTIEITGSDAESGLNAKPYSWDGTTWTDVATKVVNTNGVYTGYIRDAVGNISSTTISVANIDKVAPTISGYSYSTEAPCNTSVVVTVSATDTGLGLASSAYSFNGGAYGTSNKFTVTANGTYTVAVKDKAGNITNGSFSVSNLDFDAPVISSVVPSTTAETNKDVTLTINATDNVGGLGLTDKAYRLQGYGDWQVSNVVTVTCNGTYTVEVKDKAGNIASKSIEIANIDKEPPTASHVLSITSPTNTDVVSTLTILDNKGIKKVVTPDGTVVTQVSFQSITDYTFSKNGSYTFEIWDTADNKTTHTVDISNIDKDKPVIDSIERSTTKECNTYVDITVNAHDAGLGLEAKAFKFTGGDWQSANTLRVSSNGTYSVSVRDVAGNITTQEFSVLNLDFDKPVIKAMTLSTTSQTNKNLTLTVTAEDVGLGLAKSAYRINSGAWQESNVFTITENGTYTIEVIDKAGNIQMGTKTVTNIDKVAPSLSASVSTTDPTNQDVVVTLKASDDVEISKVFDANGESISLTKVSNEYTGTISESANGTFTYKAVDTAGNETTCTVKITNIDKSNPVIDSIGRSTTVPVNTQVVITVNAHDVGLGLADKPYKFDGTGWVSDKTKVITANGNYRISVKDVAGNITTQTYNVMNLDFDAPKVNGVSLSTASPTNKDVVLTIDAEDVGLGLADKAYRVKDETWQASPRFTVSQNGTYTYEIIDKAGNIASVSKEVTNIDKVAPTISAKVNTTDPTNKDIEVTLTASDNVGISKVVNTSGVALTGTVSGSNMVYVTKEPANGTFTYTVTDTAGNTALVKVTIANVDKSLPVIDSISKSTEDPINTDVVVTVTAHDVGLGLADKPYKFDNGDWTDVASTTITSNGTYTVQIKDKAGNVITESYEVSNLDFIAPVISSAKVLQTRPVSDRVTVSVRATDEGFGLADKAYKLSDGDWQTNNWFDVTDNGTYTVYVRDKAGNIASKTVEVKNIDRVKPELTYTLSTTEPTPYFDIEVIGTDNMELSLVACNDSRVVKGRTNWVSTTECRQIFRIGQNGTYRFEVRDFARNTNYVDVTVTNIDNVPPTIDKIIKNPDVPTNAPLEITIIASDVGFGLADKPYRVDGSEWQSSNKFMISDNGVHEIDVRDKAGNTLMMTTDISNLDYDNPVVDEVTQDITEPTNKNVVLTVTAHDVGLGLDRRPYKFGDGVWKSTNKFTVEENGDYVISVRDAAGNVETYTHTVSNIDKESPVASHTVDIDTPTNSDVVITFKATDNVKIKSITLPDKVVQDIGSNEATIPFTVSKNGTYTFKVLDTAGNITTYPVEVDNIDKEPAEIVASPSVEGWTNQDIELNVVITDDTLVRKVQSQGIWYDLDAGELPNGAVVEKGGQDRILKVKFSIPVSDNGTFEFKAIDFGGLETTYSYEVTTIDRVDPEIFAKIVNTDPTKDGVDIAITTSDAYGEVSQIVLPGDNKIDGVETSYVATDNGEYKFTVIDKAGNSAETVVKVGNIDRVAPTFNYELSPNEDGWSNDSVLLKVIGSDENGISAYKLFFGEEEIKALDGGVFQLFENGTYRIVVIDTVGNYSEAEITVGNIDKDAPTIAVGLKNKYWVNKSNTIVITGQDNSSGVSGYSLDGENWQESNEFKVSYKNSYTVYVKDLAGNVSSVIVYFDLVEEPVEEVKPLPEEEPKDDEDEDIVAPKSDLEDGSLIVIGELTDLPIEATEAKATESNVVKVVKKIAENVAEVAKVVFPYAAVLLLATVGCLVFILLTDGVRVYGKNKKGKWQYLGIARCHKGVVGCTVRVNRSVLKKVDSADYLLKFNTRYSTINKGLELYIKVGNQAITSNVYKQVEFSVMK